MKQLLLVLLVACGGAHKEPAAPAPEHHDEHGEMPVELRAFHDVLAPNWHAAQGPDRQNKTCAQIGDFEKDADAIAKAPWSHGGHDLVESVSQLRLACTNDTTSQEQFQAAFEKVHNAFHALLEQAGGEHHEEH